MILELPTLALRTSPFLSRTNAWARLMPTALAQASTRQPALGSSVSAIKPSP